MMSDNYDEHDPLTWDEFEPGLYRTILIPAERHYIHARSIEVTRRVKRGFFERLLEKATSEEERAFWQDQIDALGETAE